MAERFPWDRLDDEPSKAYEAFRNYRDAGPLRTRDDGRLGHPKTREGWSRRWHWQARAVAWDDACHAADDARRLEAIRDMHGAHVRAGRAAIAKALEALEGMDADDIPAAAAARLLDLGARLERSTLTMSVEELQGTTAPASGADDPWDRIARELAGDPSTD